MGRCAGVETSYKVSCLDADDVCFAYVDLSADAFGGGFGTFGQACALDRVLLTMFFFPQRYRCAGTSHLRRSRIHTPRAHATGQLLPQPSRHIIVVLYEPATSLLTLVVAQKTAFEVFVLVDNVPLVLLDACSRRAGLCRHG